MRPESRAHPQRGWATRRVDLTVVRALNIKKACFPSPRNEPTPYPDRVVNLEDDPVRSATAFEPKLLIQRNRIARYVAAFRRNTSVPTDHKRLHAIRSNIQTASIRVHYWHLPAGPDTTSLVYTCSASFVTKCNGDIAGLVASEITDFANGIEHAVTAETLDR